MENLRLQVSIEKGPCHITHKGLIVWVADKLWNEEFLMDGDLKSHYDHWPNLPRVGSLQNLLALDHLQLQLQVYHSFQQTNDIRWCGNLWQTGTDGSVQQEEGTMGAGVVICPPDIRAMTICPGRCPCRQGQRDGRPASSGPRCDTLIGHSKKQYMRNDPQSPQLPFCLHRFVGV